ncbi:MAG TPA: type II toxin-antitoxin system PemK/MazF family toxin [Candidatus Faecousia faecipullorum]|nr:type II toxin-antitoxin system PemK/MazF family toxin [Candidatus Faecousia faecipullorum]
MENRFLRGDLYRANLGEGMGYELSGVCNVVIVQNDTGNLHSPNVIVAGLAAKNGNFRRNPVYAFIRTPEGQNPTIADLAQLRTVDKSRLVDYLGHLSQRDIDGIDRALRISLGLSPAVREDSMLLTLCGNCARNFFHNPDYRICRANPFQNETDVCTVCNYRRGFDYVIQRRLGRNEE